MGLVDSPVFANLLYLLLVAGLWLAAWAVVTPGTGFLELFALLALASAGIGTAISPLNTWALVVLIAGAILFAVSVWRSGEIHWLALSVLAFCVGSVFLFRLDSGGAAVHPALAVVASLLTVGFFWFVIRVALAAHQGLVAHDPAKLLGKMGEVRTALDPVGSVYIEGELWSARAAETILAGEKVRVVAKDGLMLKVEGIDAE